MTKIETIAALLHAGKCPIYCPSRNRFSGNKEVVLVITCEGIECFPGCKLCGENHLTTRRHILATWAAMDKEAEQTKQP